MWNIPIVVLFSTLYTLRIAASQTAGKCPYKLRKTYISRSLLNRYFDITCRSQFYKRIIVRYSQNC